MPAREALPLELGLILSPVTGRRRMAQRRLDVAQAGRERYRRGQALDERIGPLPRHQVDGDDRAAALVEELRGPLEIGVRGQQRVVDPRDLRVRFESAGQLEGRRTRPVHAQAQGREAAKRQPAFEGIAGLAERRGHDPGLLDQAAIAHDRPERQVAMAADHLRHRMHDEVRPVLQRPADRRERTCCRPPGGSRPPGRDRPGRRGRRRGARDW